MEEIRIQGWKGKSTREIIETGDNYKVIEYRKNKDTGDVSEQVKLIPKFYVKVVKEIIQNNFDVTEICGYRYLVNKLKAYYGFEVDVEAWNGGRNRSKYYFPYHYYPLKILEAQGVIRYSGGRTMRLQ